MRVYQEKELKDFDLKMIAMMEEIIGGTILITNRERIIGCSTKNRNEFSGKALSAPFIRLIKKGETYVQSSNDLYDSYVPIMENYKESEYIVVPINGQRYIKGSVVLLNYGNATGRKIKNCRQQLAELFANKIQ